MASREVGRIRLDVIARFWIVMKLEKPLNLDDAKPGLLAKVASEQGEKSPLLGCKCSPHPSKIDVKMCSKGSKVVKTCVCAYAAR